MTGRLVRVLVAGLLAGGLVAACGGSTEPAGSTPASPDRTASGDIAPTGPAESGDTDVGDTDVGDVEGGEGDAGAGLPASPVPVDADPCSLLTAAEVEAATGEPVTGTEAEPPITCLFAVDGVDVFVSVEDGQGRLGGPAALYQGYQDWVATGEAFEVEGLGESALYAPSVRGLAVHVGDGVYVALGVNGGYTVLAEPQEALVALADLVVSRV